MSDWKKWGIAAIVLVVVGFVVCTYFVTDAIVRKIKGPKHCKSNSDSCNAKTGAGAAAAAAAARSVAAAAGAKLASMNPLGPSGTSMQQASQQAQADLQTRAHAAARGAHAQAMAEGAGAYAPTQGFTSAHMDMADGTGKLPPLLSHPPGDTMYHMAPTAIKHTSLTTDSNAFHDSTAAMARFDPEGAARIDRALALTGVPGSFHYSEEDAAAHKRTHGMKNMLLAGKVDPTVEEVLSAASPFTATARQIRSAVMAQGAIDRSTIIATPLSKLYQNPLYRAPTPMPTMSVLPQDGMTAGQQFAYQSLACAATGAPVTSESY